MSNTFTLDALRAEVDKQYAPFKIPLPDGTEVTLRNPLRLGETTRKKVNEALKSISGEKEDSDGLDDVDDIAKVATDIILMIGDSNAKKLIKEIDGDAALLIHVIEAWTESTQLGEASNSPDSSTSTASSSSPTSDDTTESTCETSS